jgi:diadenosine tetraphosphatase ApaH/serine/threonine PP2A family protein phosphatase
MTPRIIAIGDIHGCADEFASLLQRLEITPSDRVILLGDLVNRGPDSRRVLELARASNCIPLLGNHELRLLEHRRSGGQTKLKETDAATLAALTLEDWAYLETFRTLHYEPEIQTVFVHGGFVPGLRWSQQPKEVVTSVQVIDELGQGHKRADCPSGVLWADLWSGPPFVVYGHIPRPNIYKLKWSVGIDTACVMGGYLTAYVLPEKRFIQVKAKQRYFG